MLTAEKKKKYTVDDYMLLEEGAPFQLINYDLIMSPSPVPIHQLISIRLSSFIFHFLDGKNDEGFFVTAPMDVKLNDGNVFQPDMLYVSAERREALVKNYIDGTPDLVIEILSPSNAYYDLRQKKDIYEKYGVKEYIIIDPIVQTAELYVLNNGAYYLDKKAGKSEQFDSAILSGFTFDLAKIFK